MTHFAFVNKGQNQYDYIWNLNLIDKCKMCHFECHGLIYAEQNPNRTRDICFGSRRFRCHKRPLFFQSFDFECRQRQSVEPQSVLFCDFFLVGILTVEPKTLNHDLDESLFGFISTLLPTVHSHHKNFSLQFNIREKKFLL